MGEDMGEAGAQGTGSESSAARDCAEDLVAYIHAGPSPWHCVAESARRLEAEGFERLDEASRWCLVAGDRRYVVRGGSLVAFRVGSGAVPEAGFRLLGAHTDSPNLRLKPQPDVLSKGYQQFGVEIYGGVLNYTWLDRDLGLSGRVIARDASGALTQHLVRIDRPILRVPSLAIHLNRAIRTEGLKLNAQTHMPPVLGLQSSKSSKSSESGGSGESATSGEDEASVLKALLSAELGLEPDCILTWDLGLMDVVPPCLGGVNEEFVFAPRLDNQAMCHAGLLALLGAGEAASTQVLCLYDHEEVGSSSAMGAAGALVEDILRRLAEVATPGAEVGGLARAAVRSLQISADMAHAVHPNYSERHEPQHMPHINAGPVIKINSQQRYATDAHTAGVFEALCQDLALPYQKFVNRTDLACGSTIGPISAARLGIGTVDVGNPMLSMHSIREQGGAEDPLRMVAVMTRFLSLGDDFSV